MTAPTPAPTTPADEEKGTESSRAMLLEPAAAAPATATVAAPNDEPPSTTGVATDTTPAARLRSMPIDAIRKSPFQPKGRPSQDAISEVATAIARLGSVEQLVAADGQTTFQGLSPEAKRLAELAYSVARDGVRDPIEVREAEDGAIEALSGHRRIAAARLIGKTEVPILDRGAMSSVQAAATVLSGNLHRENFTPWQEAVLVTEVIAQRRADSLPADVRTVGAIMGYSHGRVSTLQTIRRVLSDAFLGRLGELTTMEEALARYGNYSRLEEVARLPDDVRRETALRRLLGLPLHTAVTDATGEERIYDHRPKRRGGFTIEVFRAIEELAPHDASALRDLFAAQLARLDARLQSTGSRT